MTGRGVCVCVEEGRRKRMAETDLHLRTHMQSLHLHCAEDEREEEKRGREIPPLPNTISCSS